MYSLLVVISGINAKEQTTNRQLYCEIFINDHRGTKTLNLWSCIVLFTEDGR